jgi:hypothetical protein
MLKKIVILSIILSIYGIILGNALELLPLTDQYYNNKSQLTYLNLNKTLLEDGAVEANNSLLKSEEQIRKIDNDTGIFGSQNSILEMTIQENENKKKEIEKNIHLINVLNNKESIFLLGVIPGAIAGLWMVSLALVYHWRRKNAQKQKFQKK